MRKKLSVLLCAALLFTMIIPQAAFADTADAADAAVSAAEVSAPEYVPYSCRSTGAFIASVWKVKEDASTLKVYRSESKDGEFQLIGSTTGTETKALAQWRKENGEIVFRDTDVEPGKTYYYKAVNEVSLDDGTVAAKESPRAYQLSATNKGASSVKFDSQLLNKGGTYSKTMTWKLTSDAANYKLQLLRKNMKFQSVHSKGSAQAGKTFTCKIDKVQYSFDGKTYKTLSKSTTLKPGESIYLKVTFANKVYIRKDGVGSLTVSGKYLQNNGTGAFPASTRVISGHRPSFDFPALGDHASGLDAVWGWLWDDNYEEA